MQQLRDDFPKLSDHYKAPPTQKKSLEFNFLSQNESQKQRIICNAFGTIFFLGTQKYNLVTGGLLRITYCCALTVDYFLKLNFIFFCNIKFISLKLYFKHLQPRGLQLDFIKKFFFAGHRNLTIKICKCINILKR